MVKPEINWDILDAIVGGAAERMEENAIRLVAGQPIKAGDWVYSEDGTTIWTAMQFGLADAPEKPPRDEHWADQLIRHRRDDDERAKHRADLRRIERRQRLPHLRFWRRVRLPMRLLFLRWMSRRQWEGCYRMDDVRLWK